MDHAPREDYRGSFDPDFHLRQCSRGFLAVLAREYLLCGHLIDRIGLPLIMSTLDRPALVRFSVDEWMGASPIYSARMQRALGFSGHDVGTLFKNLQLDIGAPPQFMDFRMRVDSPDYGEFWLDHCGALVDLEPWGDEMVTMMCHDIEDPTFDATAAATNPRMKVRPIHRPPRRPTDRHPHCHWKVFVDVDGDDYEQHPNLSLVADSLLATIPIDTDIDTNTEPTAESGGREDYAGPFDPDLELEDFSHAALGTICQEAAVQAHLLVRAYLLAVTERVGPETAADLGRRQWTGIAAVAARRLAAAAGIAPSTAAAPNISSVAKALQLHPHFWPRTYVDLRVELVDDTTARVEIGPCPALDEADDLSWFAGLDADVHPALDALVQAIDPRASCSPAETGSRTGRAWDIVIDPTADPAPPPEEVGVLSMSTGAEFPLEIRRRPRS